MTPSSRLQSFVRWSAHTAPQHPSTQRSGVPSKLALVVIEHYVWRAPQRASQGSVVSGVPCKLTFIATKSPGSGVPCKPSCAHKPISRTLQAFPGAACYPLENFPTPLRARPKKRPQSAWRTLSTSSEQTPYVSWNVVLAPKGAMGRCACNLTGAGN